MSEHDTTSNNDPEEPAGAGRTALGGPGDPPPGGDHGKGRRRRTPGTKRRRNAHAPDDPPRPSRRRVLRWSAAIAAVLLLPTAGAAYLGYRRLSGNISHEKVKDRLGARPPKYNKSLNILLIGSDTRAGDNARFGHTAGARSDTIILLHISPHRDGATAISFPRDLMVKAPACTTATGAAVPAAQEMINATFSSGGAACTWKTIESITGVHIDHFMQIDFSGFKRMVDALGGVEVCLPKAVNDSKSHLHLAAGRHTVTGDTALAYVRTRYALGDGSDLDRIKRQQLFMAAVVRKATSTGLATNPARLYRFLNAATHSLTTDDDLDLGTLRTIADSVRGMSSGKVAFLTAPNHAWEVDPNRVVLTQHQATRLFTAISNDTGTPAASASPSRPASGPDPATIPIRVLNGNGRTGLARQVTAQLHDLGYTHAKAAATPAHAARTSIRTTTAGQTAARALAGAFTRAPGLERQGGTGATLTLLIGADWTAPAGGHGIQVRDTLPTPSAPTPSPTLPPGVTADTDACHA